ncbi:hypothetical protein L1987_03612 [Smallanthus sonchifolius]|uniref:Uncharacterized protein n=1 Tax=Smallanthus sonchifolius TaxID=185202 RepID=A0ACB9KB33_9ASTR|nr:hypothetical protein L1987_03612 [Smallanthus sonchifolius]
MKYKVNIEGIVNTIASKSIQMIEPVKIDPEELAGLEWQINDLKEIENSTLVPKQSHIYENVDGTQSLRFTDFKREDKYEESTCSEEQPPQEPQYNFMTIESDDESEYGQPIYDTENEEEEDEYLLDSEFLKFEQEDIDYSLLEEIRQETNTIFKSEEINKSYEQIINRKFTEANILEEVDDMIVECMLNLKMTYEESYKKLQEDFNLPLVNSIVKGDTMISDFYKKQDNNFMNPEGKPKRNYQQYDLGQTSNDTMGREPWTKPVTSYQQESGYNGTGRRLPIGQIYSGNMLLLEQQKPQLWVDEVLIWEQTVVRM